MRRLDETILDNLLKYIINYQKNNGKSPSYRNIMKDMKFSGLASVIRYMNRLYSENKIQKDDLGGIQISQRLNPSKTIIAPMVGTVTCGIPILAEENIEGSYTLPADIFGSSETFLLHAKGESMINAGIKDKDILVVKKCSSANDGEIVIALIENEATAKRMFRKNGKIILHPENPEFDDIIVDDVTILGVVSGCIHRF